MTANSSVFALTGYAQNEREKVQIADAVLPVVGSLSLNNLLIANPDQVQKNSAHAELIAEKIANVVGLGSEWIRVAVANDTAQLVGKVNHLWEKEAAEVEVRRCEISRVANDLTVIHPS